VAAAAGSPQASAATQPAGGSTDALDAIQANRSGRAKELVAEGKAALDDNKPDVAVGSFERAVVLAPNDAEAQKLLEQARALLAKQTPSEKTVLGSLEERRRVSKQVANWNLPRLSSCPMSGWPMPRPPAISTPPWSPPATHNANWKTRRSCSVPRNTATRPTKSAVRSRLSMLSAPTGTRSVQPRHK